MTVYTQRSNRPVTQFACDRLREFMEGNLKTWYGGLENTSIDVRADKRSKLFRVFVYRHEVLNLAILDEEPVSLRISVGDFFDNWGYPTKTILERLNGLLDELGFNDVLPMGVRIFKDRNEGLCYIGKGDNKVAVGRNVASSVLITPDKDKLMIDWTDLNPKQPCPA